MKTPKEIAEEMTEKTAVVLFGGEPNSEVGKCIIKDDSEIILAEIPLTELIAVARAAVLEGNYQPDVKGEDFGYWISEEDFEKLEDALQALRATGKIEL